jgi:hypothetical protein
MKIIKLTNKTEGVGDMKIIKLTDEHDKTRLHLNKSRRYSKA